MPNFGWIDSYLVEIEWLFASDAPTLGTEKKEIGVVEEPGNANSGGIASWDHDNDPSTQRKILAPGIGSSFDQPVGGVGVFLYEKFVQAGIDPDLINNVEAVDVNGDGLEDLVLLTAADEPSYVLLNDPASPGTLKEPTAIGAEEHDDRDVEFVDVNTDGVRFPTHYFPNSFVSACFLMLVHSVRRRFLTALSLVTTRPTQSITVTHFVQVISH